MGKKSGRVTHCERVLDLFGDGEAHSHREVYGLGVVGHSRIAELRAHGYVFEHWKESRSGETLDWYRLVSVPERPPPRLRVSEVPADATPAV